MATRKPQNLPRGVDFYRGHYRARIYFEGRQHHLGMFDTIGDASAALTIAKAEKARGTFAPPAERRQERAEAAARIELDSLTLADWAETWLANLLRDGGAESSNVTHRSVLRKHVLPELGDEPLTAITPTRVQALIDQVRARPSSRYKGQTGNGVAANVARTLRACLNAAVDDPGTGLTVSPFRVKIGNARRVRPEDPDGDVATPEEVRAMADAMPEHWRIAVPLAAWCAVRVGEVLGLERRDLEHLGDPERATLHVRRQWNSKTRPPSLTPPKSDSARSIAIPAFLLPELREHLERFTGAGREAPVLSAQGRPKVRAAQTTFDAAWRAARKTAGRPAFRFHDLRHTGLTAYAREGATLAELMHRGGHSDVTVALRYQHATAERDRALTARMGQTAIG